MKFVQRLQACTISAGLALAVAMPTYAAPAADAAPAGAAPLADGATPTVAPVAQPLRKPWYQRISLHGYTQLRYNQLPTIRFNDDFINDQGDKSVGPTGGFFFRRARLILSGAVHPRVHIYLQPDLASAISDQLNVTILRDWFADVWLDDAGAFRVRAGQSKVPYGFENMQSSQNRLALDRNDALNSAVKDERDIGLFFYWAPPYIRERFRMLVTKNLKGSGDYGVFALGLYNGQTANRRELTKAPHVVARVTWPFEVGGQTIETSLGGYAGTFEVATAAQKDGTTYRVDSDDGELRDARAHATFVLYPRPFGIQAEYTIGKGPQQGRDAATQTTIASRRLQGGYVTATVALKGPFGTEALLPFVRATTYDGGKKFMTNAPYYRIRELELGAEWQIWKALELVLAYDIATRTSDKYPYRIESGHVGRAQLQFSY